jgi:hypothetical protein
MSKIKFTIYPFNDKTILTVYDDKIQYHVDGFLGGATIHNGINGLLIREEKVLELYFCDIQGYGFKNCGWTSGYFEFKYFDPSSKLNLLAKIVLGRSSIGNAKKVALEAEPIDNYIRSVLNEYIQARSATVQESSTKSSEPQAFSFADELSKLNDLLQKGAITQEEYSTLKSRIINK